MKNNIFLNSMWSCLVIDGEMKIIEISNFDSKLFFGREPIVGKTIKESAGEENKEQVSIIIDGIHIAQTEKRHACFVYPSTYTKCDTLYVSLHTEYHQDGTMLLYFSMLNSNDMQLAQKSMEHKKGSSLKAIYEDLPVSIEIYDKNGILIEVNAQGVEEVGVKSKEDLLGYCLFENPLLPREECEKLLKGIDTHFNVGYNYDEIKHFFNTSKTGSCNLDVLVKVLKNKNDEIDGYISVSQDISDHIQLKNRYQDLYNQNITVLNSLPIGINIYTKEGLLSYRNSAAHEVFGTNADMVTRKLINIHENPQIPNELKVAIKDGRSIKTDFSYDFKKVQKTEINLTNRTDIVHVECRGEAVLNASEEVDCYVLMLEDITENRRKDEILRQNRCKIDSAMQLSDIIFWEFDVEKQIFFSENEPLNNYDNSQLLSIEEYLKIIHPEDMQKVIPIMERALNGENINIHIDMRMMLSEGGKWQHCSLKGSPYEFDTDGRVTKYIGTRKDDTILYKKQLLQEKILNSIPLAIHIKDVEDNYRYVFCNDESKNLLGIDENKTTYDITDEETVKRIHKTDLEVVRTGEPYHGFDKIILKNGNVCDTIVRKSVIDDDGKKLLLSTRWDQSLQNNLKRRSKLFEVTLDAMDAYTWLFEPESGKVTFGDGFETEGKKDTSGTSTLKEFLTLVHPDEQELFFNTLNETASKETGTWEVSYRASLNGDGHYTWWETRGLLETNIINDMPYKYMFGMSISIENHKQAEATLQKNKEDLKQLVKNNELILNNSNSGLAYIDTNYIVQWENVSLCSASISYEAYKRGDYCYKSAHNRTEPCDDCVMKRAIKSRQMERIDFVLQNNRKVEVFATPVINDNGTMDGIVIRIDDITEREDMIQELKQAKALAEQSDKLKSAFLANMSHEIRTPLNAIVGFSELMMNSPEEDEKEEYIQIINNNNELLLKLINDILDLSKIEAGSIEFSYEKFDIAEYFNSMAASMRQRISNPNVRLIDVNPYSKCNVYLDKNRLAQLMTNYVTNAIKYTPKGFIEIGYECIEESIRFYVKDSGIGIHDDKKDKVFQRFAKLDEFAQGTGLGLSICKAIAESMGGSVGFESTYGEGSIFWAILPCDPDIDSPIITDDHDCSKDNHTHNTVVEPKEATPERQKTIIIAEDIYSNYLLLSTLLKKRYNLLRALNGEEAIELVKNNSIDLILMDMKMPKLDGLKATAMIREFNKTLPIIALTAHAFESDRVAALEAGCNEYLVKPIDQTRLIDVLQKYCPTITETKKENTNKQ